VNFFDCFGTAYEQMFRTAFELRTTVIINGQVLRVQIRAHGSVKDDDAIAKCVEKVTHPRIADCRFPIADLKKPPPKSSNRQSEIKNRQ
jgi:hypothetical protein